MLTEQKMLPHNSEKANFQVVFHQITVTRGLHGNRHVKSTPREITLEHSSTAETFSD